MNKLAIDPTQQNPLLATKLYLPRAGQSVVSRPRLTAQLNEGLSRALTLISAPAGFGKTTLLSDWAAALRAETQAAANRHAGPRPAGHIPPRLAWLSLDEADNDPAGFFKYLTAALQTIRPDIGRAALSVLRRGGGNPAGRIESALAILINDVAVYLDEAVIILDDYHLITAPAVHQILSFLLDYRPPQMHLVISGRTAPPLPLARLRAQGQLLELRAADLRFTADEAALFLDQVMQLDLSAADIAALEAKTEGWIAGLQLAALSMRDREDVSGFIASFTGSHRYILDYLAEEVLARQPETVQTFLLQTSILNRLTAPLCDAILNRGLETQGREAPGGRPRQEVLAGEAKKSLSPGRSDSQEMLKYLEQADLFLIPLDDERRWCRYHHLFAEFLRDRLHSRVGQEGVAILHRRAAEWCEQKGLAAEATGYALAAADVERAARLIEQSGRTILRRSELATLLKWVEALPAESIRMRPRLSLFEVWALVLTGRFEAVEERLADFDLKTSAEFGDAPATGEPETISRREIKGEITAIRATLAYFRRDMEQAAILYRFAFEQLPPENLFLRGAVAMSLATAYHLQGDLTRARWAFAEARAIGEAQADTYTVLMAGLNLAHLHVEQGELLPAVNWYRQTWRMIASSVEPDALPYIAGRVPLGLAQVLYQWNELEAAATHSEEALKWGRQRGDGVAVAGGYLMLARIKQAQGALQAAFEQLEQARSVSHSHRLSGWQVRLAAYQAQLHLKQSDLEAALQWSRRAETGLHNHSSDDSAGFFEDLRRLERLTQARWLIAHRRPDEALQGLAPLLQAARSEARTGQIIEILILQALAYQAQDNLTQAAASLDQALTSAAPAGYIRLFVDEGEPAADLLRYMLSRALTTQRAYADRLLIAFKAQKEAGRAASLPALPTAPPVDPLSDRELEILQLIAAGLSNKQIAEQLVLTVGTVKWHINNIYSKLGVRRRTQALARARLLDLL